MADGFKTYNSWKVSRSSKISGNIKLSNDHSSARLFCQNVSRTFARELKLLACNGVPVKIIRPALE